jgi:hypothetical protein
MQHGFHLSRDSLATPGQHTVGVESLQVELPASPVPAPRHLYDPCFYENLGCAIRPYPMCSESLGLLHAQCRM